MPEARDSKNQEMMEDTHVQLKVKYGGSAPKIPEVATEARDSVSWRISPEPVLSEYAVRLQSLH